MNLTVITLWFSVRLSFCVTFPLHIFIKEMYFSGWLVILVLTALLVSITVYIEPPPRERKKEPEIP